MSLEDASREDLEIWRSQEITEQLVAALMKDRRVVLEMMAVTGRLPSSSEAELRVLAGKAAGIDMALALINTKGKDE